MDDLIKKIKLIYRPFLIIGLSYILIYTFLNWLLFIKFPLFQVNEDLLHFAPFLLSLIPLFIWLRPRVKLLKFKNDNIYFLYYGFSAWFIIGIPAVLGQDYLSAATGKLTALDTIKELHTREETKYYTLKKYFLDRTAASGNSRTEIGGKHSEYLNMYHYISVPLLSSPADTSATACRTWIGTKYHKQISNNLSDIDKEASFRAFLDTCRIDFQSRKLEPFVYLHLLGVSSDASGYRYAAYNNDHYRSEGKEAIVFEAVNEPFALRTGTKLEWAFGVYGIGCTLWFLMLIYPKFDPAALRKYEKGKHISGWEIKSFLKEFSPNKAYLVSTILIYVNVGVFLLMAISGLGFINVSAYDLLKWGGNFRPMVHEGEWWRLFTSLFLHGGIMHLISNMVALYMVGVFLEPLLGRKQYLIIYLVTGLLASLTSLLWHEDTVSVGASGAIFGLYGMFLVFLLLKVFDPVISKIFLGVTLLFIGGNLVMGLIGHIDNAAHLGGLVSGFYLGYLLHEKYKEETNS